MLALFALCHQVPDARSRRLNCWRPGFQLWVTLTGKTRGVESMPSEGSPALTLWFAVCVGHRFVKERLTFTILQQLAVSAVVGSLGRKGVLCLTFWA